MIATLLFYLFSAVLLGSAVMVISVRNPVHAVLSLILAFFNAAALFVLLGAEYLAMTLVIVYVGAVAVLFLFVVMMLDVNFTALREGFLKYLPAALSVAALLFVEVFGMIYAAALRNSPRYPDVPTPLAEQVSNTQAIGQVLYTHYMLPFQLAGMILLLAMVGAIVLTLRRRTGVRKQTISRQVSRSREESVMLVRVQPREGV